jgi:thiol-disulfide isomerase/thioredoxin
MIKIYLLFAITLIVGCKESNERNDLIKSVAKTQEELEGKDVKENRMRMAEIGSISPIGKLTNLDSESISTKEFEGKLLVIDFWATWCSPCLDEAPIFKELEKKYESERIEFITVSIDDEFDYWREYILDSNWQTDNYWFGMKETEPFFSFIYSEMEIKGAKKILMGLPKYVIVSPDGIIINNQASKPSDPKFEQELKLIMKKYAS